MSPRRQGLCAFISVRFSPVVAAIAYSHSKLLPRGRRCCFYGRSRSPLFPVPPSTASGPGATLSWIVLPVLVVPSVGHVSPLSGQVVQLPPDFRILQLASRRL